MSLLVKPPKISAEEVRDAILSDGVRFPGANIDARISEAGVKVELVSHGTLLADGTEQEMAELLSATPVKFYGWISLDEMDIGDKVTIRTYAKDEAGAYKVHATELYQDALEQPMVNLMMKVTEAYRVTLEQTAGTYRSFDYRFFKEG